MRTVAAGECGPALSHSPRILVIRLRRFGDLLLATPTLRAIREAYSSARLDVLVSAGFHQALIGNRCIDELLVLEPGAAAWLRAIQRCRAGRYDAVIDLQSSSHSMFFVLASAARIRVGWQKRWVRDWVYNRLVPGWDAPIYLARNMLRMAAPIGVATPADVQLDLEVSAADRARAAALFEQAGIDPARPVIALSVVAKAPHKRWPAERYAALADQLIRTHGAQLIFGSGAGEIEQVRAVVAQMRQRPALWNHGPTTIQELGAIYERCHLWIGNDGGPKHVATAVGCPTVVIIKPNDERFWTDCAEDASQVAVQALPQAGPLESLAAVTVDQVYAAASRDLNHISVSPASSRHSGLNVTERLL